jgi:hypothetical protein
VSHREEATVESVTPPTREDHGALVCTVLFKLGAGGSFQGWQSVILSDDTAQLYVDELCRVFGVESLADIAGKRCAVLRSFSDYNEMIEGVEVEGRRFTTTMWRRRWHPDLPGNLEQRRQDLRRNIASLRQSIALCERRLGLIDDDFVDWSKP